MGEYYLTELCRPDGTVLIQNIYPIYVVPTIILSVNSDGIVYCRNNSYIRPPWILKRISMGKNNEMIIIDSSDNYLNKYIPRKIDTPFGMVVIREKTTYPTKQEIQKIRNY